MANGDISSSSKDAISGSQLYSANNALVAYLDSDAKYENGHWTAPSFSVATLDAEGNSTETSYDNVSEAFAAVNSSFKNTYTNIRNEFTSELSDMKSDNLIQQSGRGGVITIGDAVGGTAINIANSTGGSRKLTGLADGDISSSSKDAISGSQLYSMGETLATYFGGDAKYVNGHWTAPSFSVATLDVDGNSTEESYDNVSEAFAAVNSSFENTYANIRKEFTSELTNMKSDNLVQQSGHGGVITIGDAVGGAAINIANKSHVSRKLTGLADGDISSSSKDAINGSQLYSANNALAAYLGGGAKYENGEWKAPSFNVATLDADGNSTEESYDNVAKAFDAVNSSFKNTYTNIRNEFTSELSDMKSDNLIQQSGSSGTITIGDAVGGTAINIANSTGGSRKLTGLADGDISSSSKDAISGSQLYSMGETLATYLGGDAKYVNGYWTAPSFSVATLDADGNSTEESYDNVSEAFAAVNSSFKNTYTNIRNEFTSELSDMKSDNLIQQSGSSGTITIGDAVGGTAINIANKSHVSRKLTGLADGDISSSSKDAISGSQLYSMGETLATYLGGNAKYVNGHWTAPSFNVATLDAEGNSTETSYDNVSEAFAAVNSSFENTYTNIRKEFTSELTNMKSDNLVQQSGGSGTITIGDAVGGTAINIANKSHVSRKLTGLADGDISSSSKDAINGSQLYSMGETLATYLGGNAKYVNGHWTAPSFNVATFDTEGNSTETSYDNVSEAFAAVNSSFENTYTNIRNEFTSELTNMKSDNLVQQSGSSGAITIGQAINGASIDVKDRSGVSRILTGLADGEISTFSKDAVNGSQLYSINKTLAAYLGGGAEYKNEKWSNPVFTVNTVNRNGTFAEEEYNTVADAFTAVGTSFANIKNELTNELTDMRDGLFVKQNDQTSPIKIGGETGGAAIIVSDSNGVSRSISGVKSGTLSEGSTEAVNGSQLYSMSQTLASYLGGSAKYDGEKWTAPQFEVVQFNSGGLINGTRSYNNVSSAFNGVNATFRGLDSKIDDVKEGILVKKSESGNAITIGQAINGTLVDVKNNDGVSRILTGLADGEVSVFSKDAVNGSQLYSTNKTLSAYLGGGAEYDDGKWSNPVFKFNNIDKDGAFAEEEYNTVADAFTAVGTSFANIKNELADELTDVKGSLFVKQDGQTSPIKIGGETDGIEIIVANNSGAPRSISGVKSGILSEGSTEAVNGSQLYSMSQTLASYLGGSVKYDGEKWTAPQFEVVQFNSGGLTDETRGYNNVSSAFNGVNATFRGLDSKINGVKEGLLVKKSEDGNAITIGDAINGTLIDIKNNTGSYRKLAGLEGGEISSSSKEAINGSQLYSMGEKLATYLGGDAEYKDGKWNNPTFKFNNINQDGTFAEAEYNTVADAFTAVGTSFANVKNELADVKDGLFVKQDGQTSVIKIGGETDGKEIAVANNSGAPRSISGVKSGTLSERSTEAVNGSQLYSMSQTLASYLGGSAKYDGENWTDPQFEVVQFNSGGLTEGTRNYNDVSSAFNGVNVTFRGLDSKIDDVKEGLLVKKSEDGNAITIGDAINGTSIDVKDRSGVSRILTGLADGEVSASSKEAVNGSQLYSTNKTLSAYLGGGAEYKNGKWSNPVFKVNTVNRNGTFAEENFGTVADAFTAVGTSFANIKNELADELTDVKGSLFVKQDGQTSPIKIGGETDGIEIIVANNSGAPRSISGVKSGILSEGSTEAVNGSQLYSMSQTLASYLGGSVKYDGEKWTAPQFEVVQFNSGGLTDETRGYNNVSSAFNGVNATFRGLDSKINGVKEGLLVKKSEDGNAITIGDAINGTLIDIKNNTGSYRKLAGLEGGEISSSSKEAINGSQLYSMGEKLATYLGGDAEYKDGKWNNPTFKFNNINQDGTFAEAEYNTVADAFTAVGTSFANVKNELADVKDGLFVKQDGQTSVIKIGGETDGKEISVANNSGASRNISGVKSGTLSERSTEAVNGSQLYSMSQTLASYLGGSAKYDGEKWTDPQFEVVQFNSGGLTDGTHSYNDVSSAFNGVNVTFRGLDSKINDVKEGLLVKKSEGSNAITIGDAINGASIDVKDRSGVSRILTGLADGEVSVFSKDAVNGSQLYSTNKTLAAYLGGGAEYNGGKWSNPVFKVNTVNRNGTFAEEKYNTVADAFTAVGTSFANIKNELADELTDVKGSLFVKQDNQISPIKIGGETGGTEIIVANSNSVSRSISGVKSGTLSERSTEAVNGSQLYSTNNVIATYLGGGAKYDGEKWTSPQFEVLQISSDELVDGTHSYNDVSSAFNGVNATFRGLDSKINDVKEGILVKKSEDGNAITIGDAINGTLIDIKNNTGSFRKLAGLEGGEISASSKEAVNGSQLYSTNNAIAEYLGGGAEYVNGKWKIPSYDIQGTSYSDVSSAFVGVDNSLTDVKNKIDENINKGKNSLMWDNRENAFVALHETEGVKNNSKLKFLLDGSISKGSTEAITGGQLYSMNQTLAAYLGGGAKYENESWTAPSFMITEFDVDGNTTEEGYSNVADAFAGVSNSFANIQNEFANVKDSVFVKQDDQTKAINIGGETDGTEISVANNSGVLRSISGVKSGLLSETSTEAVNGSQLYSTNNALATYFGGNAQYENGEWIAPSFQVIGFNDDGTSSEKSYGNVADALTDMSNSVAKLHGNLDIIDQNSFSWSDADEAFVAFHKKDGEIKKSKLKFLMDGDVSEGSTEAITGNQLYSFGNVLATYLGGGAGYKDGQWIAPEFKVLQFSSDMRYAGGVMNSYDTVSDAFDALNESMANISGRIDNIENKPSTSNVTGWSAEEGAYDFSHNGVPAKVINVADAEVQKGSQEVVNGGQLWETNNKITEVEKKVDDIDQHIQNVETTIKDSISYDKDESGNKTNTITLVGGDESDPVLIDNVAAGKVEEGSKQAVNGGQLYDYTKQQMEIVLDDAKQYTDKRVNNIVVNAIDDAVDKSKQYTDMRFEALSYGIENARKEARQAAAIGLAVSNLRYDDTPGKLSISFGSGMWHSQSAFAMGAGYTSENGNIRSNLSVTNAGGHFGVGVGITFTLN